MDISGFGGGDIRSDSFDAHSTKVAGMAGVTEAVESVIAAHDTDSQAEARDEATKVFIEYENSDLDAGLESAQSDEQVAVTSAPFFDSTSENDDFAVCRRLAVAAAVAAENAQKDVEPHVYTLMEHIYAYKLKHLINTDALRSFCGRNMQPCTKATLKSPFLPLFKAVYRNADAQVNSLRARALLYAAEQQVRSGGITEFLKSNGGIKGCATRVATRCTLAPAEAVSESEPESALQAGPDIQRPVQHRRIKCELPNVPDGRYNARIRIAGGKAVFEAYFESL